MITCEHFLTTLILPVLAGHDTVAIHTSVKDAHAMKGSMFNFTRFKQKATASLFPGVRRFPGGRFIKTPIFCQRRRMQGPGVVLLARGIVKLGGF
jgi:hypothetical protein